MEGHRTPTEERHWDVFERTVAIYRRYGISLLELAKMEIDCAENALRAFEMFEASPERYDMIFMDLQMPEIVSSAITVYGGNRHRIVPPDTASACSRVQSFGASCLKKKQAASMIASGKTQCQWLSRNSISHIPPCGIVLSGPANL